MLIKLADPSHQVNTLSNSLTVICCQIINGHSLPIELSSHNRLKWRHVAIASDGGLIDSPACGKVTQSRLSPKDNAISVCTGLVYLQIGAALERTIPLATIEKNCTGRPVSRAAVEFRGEMVDILCKCFHLPVGPRASRVVGKSFDGQVSFPIKGIIMG